MGCDIHSLAQVKGKHGNWKTVVGDLLDAPRCYIDFAILAGVRNGTGAFLAGVDLEPVSPPKGLPEDVGTTDTIGVEAHIDGSFVRYGDDDGLCNTCGHKDEDHELNYYYWLGDHSYSWLTLSELKTYMTKHKGEKVVIGDESVEYDDLGNIAEYVCALEKIASNENASDDDVRMVFGFDS